MSLGGKHWAPCTQAPPSPSVLCTRLQHGPEASELPKDKATHLLASCGSTKKGKNSQEEHKLIHQYTPDISATRNPEQN